MTSPTPGSTIGSTSATFQWTSGSGIYAKWLQIGTTGPGSRGCFQRSCVRDKSNGVTGLPSSGTIHVRLLSWIGSGWQTNDYTYTMSSGTKAEMTSPTPGSTISSNLGNVPVDFRKRHLRQMATDWYNWPWKRGCFQRSCVRDKSNGDQSTLFRHDPCSIAVLDRAAAGRTNDYTYTMNVGAKGR